MKTLCLYGSGGMGREIADLAFRMSKWDEIIFIDDNVRERVIDEIRLFTFEEALNRFEISELEFIVTTGEPFARKMLYNKLEQQNIKYISIIHPDFVLSRFSSIADGTIVHIGAIATVNVHIGKGCLINKHVVIGHDVTIGDYCVLSPNATIGGNVNIGQNSFIGSGAVIRNNINIGENSIIGMGAIVVNDVEPNITVVGNPAKFLRYNTEGKVFK